MDEGPGSREVESEPTSQHLNSSTAQQLNSSTAQQLNSSTPQPSKLVEELSRYEQDSRGLIKRVELADPSKFRFCLRSKSEEPRKRRAKPLNAVSDKKLARLSPSQLCEKISLLETLLSHSRCAQTSLDLIEQLEKLRGVLSQKTRQALLSRSGRTNSEALFESTRLGSPFGHYPSYLLRGFIVKAADDMRQESLIIHIISMIRRYLLEEGSQVFLCDLDFVLLSKTAAMIELLRDFTSIDSLKKTHREQSLLSIFRLLFRRNFEEAQKNFVASLAGYSLVCYLLNIKDRHNGNIMLGPEGHLVHIDFGFAFTHVPGNINFESAPFKLTQDYLDIMGGDSSPLFYFYKSLIIRAFADLKRHAESIWITVEIMMNSDLPCFSRFDLKGFKERFHRFMGDQEREKLIDSLVMAAANSSRTLMYDRFQKYSNGIEM